MLRNAPYSLTPIAVTGVTFSRFGPYVAAMGDDGAIAFQAAFVGGGSGVIVARDGRLEAVVDTRTSHGARTGLAEITSHPDFARDGRVAFYGRDARGGSGVYVADGATVERLDGSGDADTVAVGPLGPTSNADGLVAYRATARDGSAVIRVCGGRAPREPFRADGPIAAFHGLPIVTGRGAVLARVELRDGTHAIVRDDGRSSEDVVVTGEGVAELGLFPSADDDGTVVTSIRTTRGATALVSIAGTRLDTLVAEGAAYAHVRGGLLRDGHAVVFATLHEGSLGIFAGTDPVHHRIVAIGDRCLGSRVTSLAANPVSIGRAGALAIRLALADDREAIFLATPAT